MGLHSVHSDWTWVVIGLFGVFFAVYPYSDYAGTSDSDFSALFHSVFD